MRIISSSRDKDIKNAIFLYSTNIDPLQRTDSNEILFWLDNYNKRFKDKFYILGLYLDNTLIGYAQLAYFFNEKILFVDYIVLDSNYRKNNTFFEFVEQIRRFSYSNSMEFNFIVGEVGYYNSAHEPTENSRTLVRLVKMAGFKVVKTKYVHPQLGINHFESELESILMVYTDEEISSIKKETYFLILETIYFKHYQRWYAEFLGEKEFSSYCTRLKQLFDDSIEFNKKKKVIELNGYASILAYPKNGNKDSSLKLVFKWLAIFLLFIGFMFIFGLSHLIAKKKFDIDTDAQYYIVFISSLSILLFLTIIAEGKTNKIATIVEKIIKWSK